MSPVPVLAADPPGVLVRRLAVAPDYTAQGGALLAAWSAASVPLLTTRLDANSTTQTLNYDRTAPWVKLPYPAMDVAWCPFKSGESDASFATVCRSLPLQLWDREDAALRASYCATNAMGMPAQPHCILWSSQRPHLAAGYGEGDDDVHVRLFDALCEGDAAVVKYKSPCSQGMVSNLADGPSPHQQSLLLAGFMRSGQVEVIDTRHYGPAAMLRGLRAGVAQILVHPTSEYLVYAAGRVGDNRILGWDMRRCTQVFATYERAVCTQQVNQFGFVLRSKKREDTSDQHVALVSTTHDGGVLLFDLDYPTAAEPLRLYKELGPTSGLSVLCAEKGVLAVTLGERSFAVRDRYEENESEETQKPHSGNHKRRRAPLEAPELDDDSEEVLNTTKNTTTSGIAVLAVH